MYYIWAFGGLTSAWLSAYPRLQSHVPNNLRIDLPIVRARLIDRRQGVVVHARLVAKVPILTRWRSSRHGLTVMEGD